MTTPFGTNSIHQARRRLPEELRMLGIVMWVNTTCRKSQQLFVNWEKLCQVLSRHRELPSKDDATLWSPTIYLGGSILTRRAANVAALSCLVLDIDDGTPLEELPPVLKEYEWFCYSSYSHTPDHPRYRLVFPLTVDVPARRWKAFWRVASTLLVGGHADDKPTHPAAIYFMPAHPPGLKPFVVHNHGRWFSPVDWEEDVEAEEQAAASFVANTAEAQTIPVTVTAASLLERALANAELRCRNDRGVWLACQLRDNRVCDEEAELAMLQYADRVPQYPNERPYTRDEALATWRSIRSSPPREPLKYFEGGG